MKRKQYRRKTDFILGYRRGYQERGIPSKILQTMSEDFKRGYIEGRRDFRECETALY